MLIKCPECVLPISDKAVNCPHCGYPISQPTKQRKYKKKRMRLPNGFGQISEIKGKNLRNPWRVMVTVGKSEIGRPISRLLKPQSYFPTYNDAYLALLEYNKNPYDLDKSMTVGELYEKWFPEYAKSLHMESSKRTITSAWAYCSSIENMNVRDVRARHIKNVISNGEFNGHTATSGTKARIKSLFNLMLDYAVEIARIGL